MTAEGVILGKIWNYELFFFFFLGGGGGGQKKNKYVVNVWQMCSLDILLMNPISLPVFGTLKTWLLVSSGVSL